MYVFLIREKFIIFFCSMKKNVKKEIVKKKKVVSFKYSFEFLFSNKILMESNTKNEKIVAIKFELNKKLKLKSKM